MYIYIHMKHLPDGSMDQMILPSSPQLLGDPARVILAQLNGKSDTIKYWNSGNDKNAYGHSIQATFSYQSLYPSSIH